VPVQVAAQVTVKVVVCVSLSSMVSGMVHSKVFLRSQLAERTQNTAHRMQGGNRKNE
jgi:hypothetical protein